MIAIIKTTETGFRSPQLTKDDVEDFILANDIDHATRQAISKGNHDLADCLKHIYPEPKPGKYQMSVNHIMLVT